MIQVSCHAWDLNRPSTNKPTTYFGWGIGHLPILKQNLCFGGGSFYFGCIISTINSCSFEGEGLVRKGSVIWEKRLLRGRGERGGVGSNRFVCEAASWLLLLVYRQLSRLQISLLLTVGRKLAQNCVFPIWVDLFPMFAPSPTLLLIVCWPKLPGWT